MLGAPFGRRRLRLPHAVRRDAQKGCPAGAPYPHCKAKAHPLPTTTTHTHTHITSAPFARQNTPYKYGEDALFFVWRPARWANWMFEVDKYDAATGNFTFGRGGNQGARGENSGGDFFVENVFEELDSPGEFFFDRRASKLYLYHNGTGAPPTDDVVVPSLRTLVNISASQFAPARGIKHSGITYRATRYTYMDPHGVPSAGDWALDRVGAVFLQASASAAASAAAVRLL